MEFENTDEDCTIYIEELKSDDPNLKINAVSKINNIAEILGPIRTKEELIPYLMEIIEECDNDDEFLVKLGEQLVSLKDKVGGKEFVNFLLPPLEILLCMEESQVRDKAVECIKQLANEQSAEFYSTYYVSLIKQAGNLDNYPSRISCCHMIPSCFPNISQNEKLELLQLFIELSKDDTPMVRRAVASNLSSLVNLVDKIKVKNELLPIWVRLSKDSFDSVKIKAIENSSFLLECLSKQEASEILVEMIKNSDPENKSWRVRYALAEILPNMITFVEKETVSKEFLPIYESYFKDSEPEVRSIAILKFPDICSKIPEKVLSERIVPVLKGLASDTSQHVRHSIAQILVKIAKFLNSQNVIELIVPIVGIIFKDDSIDVKVALIETFGTFHQLLGTSSSLSHLLPLLSSSSTSPNWRSRLSLISYLPIFACDVGFNYFESHISNFLFSFFFDHCFAIRIKTIEGVSMLVEKFGWERMGKMIEENAGKMVRNENYLFRISGIQMIAKLKSVIPSASLKSIWKDAFEILRNDPIANVRFNLIKCYIEIRNKLNEAEKRNYNKSFEGMKKDKDHDVAYFALQI